jgi:hypothetical protein
VADAFCFWGAQAASLSFSAACRKALERSMTEVLSTRGKVVGKLPTTTGWQPVLPKIDTRTFGVVRLLSDNGG